MQEDLSNASIFREEAVEAIIEAIDCTTHNSEIQEQSARTLLILSGRFSYTGEPSIENWLLQRAGLDGVSVNAFQRHDENVSFSYSENFEFAHVTITHVIARPVTFFLIIHEVSGSFS